MYSSFNLSISDLVSIYMKQFRSVKCKMNHEPLSAERDRLIQSQDKLIHEHDFIPKTLKGINNFAICCVTCMQCYCHICGKLIE